MFSDEDDYIFADFLSAHDGTSSDNRYVLRKMLFRGTSEARFRAMISEGDKKHFYKALSFDLEGVLDGLSSMIGGDGRVLAEHRMTMMRAIKVCQCILAIDQTETNADYNNLVAYLTNVRCEQCREELKAA